MTRSRLLGAFILCLTATAALAPIAYELGRSRFGASAQEFLLPPGASEPGAFVERTDVTWACDEFGDFPGLRTIDQTRSCGPSVGITAGAPANTVKPRLRRQKRAQYGPLEEATIASIAGESFVPADYGRLEAPDPEALLPAASPLERAFAGAGGQGGAVGSPPRGGYGALPNMLLVGPGASPTSPSPPPPPPPDLITPLPGALPLLLTGLGGLAALRRRNSR